MIDEDFLNSKSEWTIELSRSAEDNMGQILLYISQNISQQQVQAFLRGSMVL